VRSKASQSLTRRAFVGLLFAFLFAPFASAQSELDQLINGLQAKYNKLSSLSADFTQIYNAPGQKSRRESGHLLLRKPGKMRWDYTAPETKLFVSDGKWLYEYFPADKYASRSAIKESGDMRAPFAFLLGRGNLRRDFKVIEFAKESPVKAGSKVLRMVPKRAADFRELVVEVELGSLQIARLSLVENGGARSDFLFSNLRENVPAGADQFTFKAPAGVELRTDN
jgi:outer membrane lipoprotein carrier protein